MHEENPLALFCSGIVNLQRDKNAAACSQHLLNVLDAVNLGHGANMGSFLRSS
jgi:hypothetical protein